MFDRFDNWLMDKLARLYVASVQRRQRRMGRGDPNCIEGIRFLDVGGKQALFGYSYRLANKA